MGCAIGITNQSRMRLTLKRKSDIILCGVTDSFLTNGHRYRTVTNQEITISLSGVVVSLSFSIVFLLTKSNAFIIPLNEVPSLFLPTTNHLLF